MKLFGKNEPTCAAVIVAAGSASRMGGIDKIMQPIFGVPVIRRTMLTFSDCEDISEIIVVTRQELMPKIAALCDDLPKVTAVIRGGDTRTDSVMNGLRVLGNRCKLVAIHDGARPLVTEEIIHKTIRRAETGYAAAPAVAVKDTIKVAEDKQIQSTPDRSKLFAVQTPQVFDYDLICAALHSAKEKQATLTDECSAVERLGKVVYLTEGSDENIKITTPIDLAFAEAILKRREQP